MTSYVTSAAPNQKDLPSQIVGIDIGHSSVKVIGVRIRHKPLLVCRAVIPLAEGHDDAFIAGAIRNVLAENHFNAKDAVLAFSDDSIVFRRTEVPDMPRGEIVEALRWKEKDDALIDMQEAAIGFEIFGEEKKPDGAKALDLVFVAVARKAMDAKIALLGTIGLNVIAVSMQPFGIENLIKLDKAIGNDRTIVAVDIGFRNTEISVLKHKNLEFVRIVPVGSQAISTALQGAITTDGGAEVRYTKDEAEEIKRTFGIAYEEASLPKGVASVQILSLMRPILEQLLKEVRRSIGYYQQEHGKEGDVTEIYLTGGGANLKNLDRYLSEELNLPVRYLPVGGIIDAPPSGLSDDDAHLIASLVGLTLGGKGRMNLITPKTQPEEIEAVARTVLIGFGVIATVIIALLLVSVRGRVARQEANLARMRAQSEMLKKVKGVQDRIVEREAFIARVKSGVRAEQIMKAMSVMIPQGVVLNAFEIDCKARTTTLRGTVYAAQTSAETVLTKFMEELEASHYFKEAQLGGIQTTPAGKDKEETSTFDISCSLE